MSDYYIKSKYIENTNTSYDIFSYIREYFNVDNPHEAKILHISASSTVNDSGDGSKRGDVSVLIRKPDGFRWVSSYTDNQYFIIYMKNNRIDLTSYSIETEINQRYINTWDVYGIRNGNEYLIDRRVNEPICSGGESYCIGTSIKTFVCQYPGTFNKFKFIHRGLDSYKEKYFSMSRVMFYGIINPNIDNISCGHNQNKRYNHCLFIMISLFNK